MKAVEGVGGYVTDCGTGGCGFTTGKTRTESRILFATKHKLMADGRSKHLYT